MNSVSAAFHNKRSDLHALYHMPMERGLSSLITRITFSDLKRKIRTWTGIRNLNLRISSPAHYHLSYAGSHASSCSNPPLETDATLARWCGHDTICHSLTTSKLTLPFKHEYDSNQIITWKQTYNLLKWHPSQEGYLNVSWHKNQDSSSGRAPG